MGMSIIIHLEPFIKIQKMYEDCEQIVRSCGEHRNYNADEFCPKCGKPVKNITDKSKSLVWISDIIGSETLSQIIRDDDEFMYIISNIRDVGIDTDTDEMILITPESIRNEVEKFKAVFSTEIKSIERKIGKNVEVDFGYLKEYN